MFIAPPPAAFLSSFCDLLTFIERYVSLHDPLSKLQLLFFRDFNLPKYSGKTYNSSTESKNCSNPYNRFDQFMEKLLLSQYVTEATRLNNILDFFLTNDSNLVHLVECSDSWLKYVLTILAI